MKNRLVPLLLALVFLLSGLSGCANQDRRVVGTCAGYDVFYEELRAVTLSAREKMARRYDAAIWDSDESSENYRGELEATVAATIAEDYAILLAAKEIFPELSLDSAEIKAAVDAAVQAAVDEYGSKSAYKTFLKEHNLTENYARLLLGRAEIELKWREAFEEELFTDTALESETAFAAWLNEGNLVRVSRITFADLESAERYRNESLASIASGSTGAVAVPSDAEASTKFYLVRGYSDDELLEADAFALVNGTPIGEIRQTENGYRVLILEENDMEAFTAYQLPTYLRNMREEKSGSEREKVLSEIAEKYPYLPNENGEKADLVTLK